MGLIKAAILVRNKKTKWSAILQIVIELILAVFMQPRPASRARQLSQKRTALLYGPASAHLMTSSMLCILPLAPAAIIYKRAACLLACEFDMILDRERTGS